MLKFIFVAMHLINANLIDFCKTLKNEILLHKESVLSENNLDSVVKIEDGGDVFKINTKFLFFSNNNLKELVDFFGIFWSIQNEKITIRNNNYISEDDIKFVLLNLPATISNIGYKLLTINVFLFNYYIKLNTCIFEDLLSGRLFAVKDEYHGEKIKTYSLLIFGIKTIYFLEKRICIFFYKKNNIIMSENLILATKTVEIWINNFILARKEIIKDLSQSLNAVNIDLSSLFFLILNTVMAKFFSGVSEHLHLLHNFGRYFHMEPRIFIRFDLLCSPELDFFLRFLPTLSMARMFFNFFTNRAIFISILVKMTKKFNVEPGLKKKIYWEIVDFFVYKFKKSKFFKFVIFVNDFEIYFGIVVSCIEKKIIWNFSKNKKQYYRQMNKYNKKEWKKIEYEEKLRVEFLFDDERDFNDICEYIYRPKRDKIDLENLNTFTITKKYRFKRYTNCYNDTIYLLKNKRNFFCMFKNYKIVFDFGIRKNMELSFLYYDKNQKLCFLNITGCGEIFPILSFYYDNVINMIEKRMLKMIVLKEPAISLLNAILKILIIYDAKNKGFLSIFFIGCKNYYMSFDDKLETAQKFSFVCYFGFYQVFEEGFDIPRCFKKKNAGKIKTLNSLAGERVQNTYFYLIVKQRFLNGFSMLNLDTTKMPKLIMLPDLFFELNEEFLFKKILEYLQWKSSVTRNLN